MRLTSSYILITNQLVSIHALLAECDLCGQIRRRQLYGFNPRTPCGVRQAFVTDILAFGKFQSTHSLRSATRSSLNRPTLLKVSIHALLAECDATRNSARHGPDCFNPRTPCGVRPQGGHTAFDFIQFQSTHSLRSATVYHCFDCTARQVSIHALLAECDNEKAGTKIYRCSFNPRTPCGVRLTNGRRPRQ